jgi:hypothetical protein
VINGPSLIADEFGISRNVAEQQIALGMVEIDGVEWSGDKLDIPREELVGKEILVRGRDRAFKLTYDPDSKRDFPGLR